MLDRTKGPALVSIKDFEINLPELKIEKLNNGVNVYWIQAGVQPVAKIDFVFKAGNLYVQKLGVSSTVNQLLKNGTSKKTAYEISEAFDYYGANISTNAGTETASISLSGLSKHLKHTLAIVKEILTDSVFPETELGLFKQNHKQILSVNLQKIDFVADAIIDEYQYGKNHPYGKFINKPEIYDDILRTDLLEFYNQSYKNSEMYIVLAGQLPEDIINILNELFGAENYKPFTFEFDVPQPTPETNIEKIVNINGSNGLQGAVRLSRNFPSRKHEDFMDCLILNMALGGFFGSRLMSNIREDKGYTYGIYSFIQNKIGDTAWQISTEAGTEVCEATIKECFYEMDVLNNKLIEEEELDLVKNYMLGSILSDLDSPFNVANRWRNLLSNGFGIDYFNQYIQSIKNITPERLQELAKKYLNPNDFIQLTVV